MIKRLLFSRELRILILFIAAAVALFSARWWASPFTKRTIGEYLYLLALAQMWNLLAGYAGLVSVGQQAWIGIGGYTLFVLADDKGINMFRAVFLAGFVTAALAIPTAIIVFRLRAAYFAIGTWVAAEVFRLLVASSTDWLKGGSGRTLNAARLVARATREDYTYMVAIAVGLGSIAITYLLIRSSMGLGLTAIRDSEAAAASLGVNTYKIKLLLFVIAAFVTGINGALIYLYRVRISPDASFSVQWTAFMIFIVVIGGIGTIEGPIVGTVIFFLIRERLFEFGERSFILLGGIAVIAMLIAPEGVWGLFHRFFKVELFPIRRLMPRELMEILTEPRQN
jgi:branched-chain amino acid transport system permease protein